MWRSVGLGHLGLALQGQRYPIGYKYFVKPRSIKKIISFYYFFSLDTSKFPDLYTIAVIYFLLTYSQIFEISNFLKEQQSLLVHNYNIK